MSTEGTGLAAVTLVVCGLLLCGVAHADSIDRADLNGTLPESPDMTSLICMEHQLGRDPATIAQEIRAADQSISPGDATQRVWSALQNCPYTP